MKAAWIWASNAGSPPPVSPPRPTRATRAPRTRKRRTGARGNPSPRERANRAHAKLRAPGERANALLKTWDILDKLRCCPWRAGKLAKAIHALQIHGA